MSLYAVLAFLIPLPLFFDLASRSFVIYSVEYDTNLVLEAGVPIPIGLAALALIILSSFLRVVRLRVKNDVALTLACLAVFWLIATSRVEPLKLLAVMLPVLLLLAASATVSQPRVVEKISRGYLAGVLFQTWLHASSMVFYIPGWESLITSSRTFFGYEIYQAWISYSAALSAAGAAGVIYALSLRNLSSSLRVLVLTVPVYLIVIGASRKAAMVDLAFIFLINNFLMLRSVLFQNTFMIRKKVSKYAFISIFLTFVALMVVEFSPREISMDDAMEQRGGSYEFLMDANFFQILTGYVDGWGGYSNFIIELIVRSGLIGMVPYLLGLTLAMRHFYLALFVSAGDDALTLRGDIYMKSWFAFALGSFLVGNLVNMNIQLPYYTGNFLMINVCFVFYYSRYLRDKFRTFPAARL